MKLGLTKSGKEVRISKKSNNRHIVIYGESGAGKSYRLKGILKDAVAHGKTVIAFNLDKVPIEKELLGSNCIDVLEDGINLSILDDSAIKGKKENPFVLIEHIKNLLIGNEKYGNRQVDALRMAIKAAIEKRNSEVTELTDIKNHLKLQGTPVAECVISKLWPLLESDILKREGKSIFPHCLNVIKLGGMPEDTQTIALEMILGILWYQVQLRGAQDTVNQDELVIVIDEIQRLTLSRKSVINSILEQGRKFEITLIVATQSATYIKKEVLNHLNGSSITLYFHPKNKEEKKIAELIDGSKVEHYATKLKKLDKGLSYVTGKIVIDGYEYDKPLIIGPACKYPNNILRNEPLLAEQKIFKS